MAKIALGLDEDLQALYNGRPRGRWETLAVQIQVLRTVRRILEVLEKPPAEIVPTSPPTETTGTEVTPQ